MSRKTMKQKQAAEVRAARMKKTPRRMDNGLLDQHEQDDYDTDESQDCQSNREADLDEMEDLNIG